MEIFRVYSTLLIVIHEKASARSEVDIWKSRVESKRFQATEIGRRCNLIQFWNSYAVCLSACVQCDIFQRRSHKIFGMEAFWTEVRLEQFTYPSLRGFWKLWPRGQFNSLPRVEFKLFLALTDCTSSKPGSLLPGTYWGPLWAMKPGLDR